MRRTAFALLLIAPSIATAQEPRFELGQRLRAFEQSWDRLNPDAAAKRRALPGLQAAFRNFFSLRLAEAGRNLDDAATGLESAAEPTPARRWADSLAVVPDVRVVDRADKELLVVVKAFYAVKGEPPAGAKMRLQVGDAPAVETAITKLPQEIRLPLPPLAADADLTFTSTVVVGGKPYAARTLAISRIGDLAKRLAAVKSAAEKVPSSPKTIEQGTLTHLNDLFGFMADKVIFETSYPAARLLAEAETLVGGKPYYDAKRPGEFWWKVPAGDGTVVARVMIPEKLAGDKVPLVIALHGAGGSENLFFDGYGDGVVVKECRKRGWIMIAPRSPGFVGAPAVVKMLDHLATRLPIDPARVYLMGHSMGASQATAIASREPNRFAAVAPLGGGGGVRKSEGLSELPFFVGVGKEDFALGSARSLAKSLTANGAKTVKLAEYPDVEHMAIVREAVADVFAFFAGATR